MKTAEKENGKNSAVAQLEALYKSEEFKKFEAQENFELELAVKLKKIREEKGLTQAKLASLMGVKQPAIARMETKGKATIETIKKFCAATGTHFTFSY